MDLTLQQKAAIKGSIVDPAAAQALIDLVSSSLSQADEVAEMGVTSNLSALLPTAAVITASAGTYAIPAEPTGAEVDAAIDQATAKVVTALLAKADNVDAETLRTQAEARLDAIEAKIDAILAALKDAGLMAEA